VELKKVDPHKLLTIVPLVSILKSQFPEIVTKVLIQADWWEKHYIPNFLEKVNFCQNFIFKIKNGQVTSDR